MADRIKVLKIIQGLMQQIEAVALKDGIKITRAEILQILKEEATLLFAEESVRKHLESGVIHADILANKVIADLRKKRMQLVIKEENKRAAERVLP